MYCTTNLLVQVRTGTADAANSAGTYSTHICYWAQGLWCVRKSVTAIKRVHVRIDCHCTRTHALPLTECRWVGVSGGVLMATQRSQRCAERCFCWLRRRRRRRHNSFTIKNVGALAFALALAHAVAFMKCKRFTCGFSCFLCCCKYSFFRVLDNFSPLSSLVISARLLSMPLSVFCVVSHNSNTFRCYVVEWVFFRELLLLVSVCFLCSIIRLLFRCVFG